ncbi:MAG: copper resistance protein B [Woeseiaceae bacterium]
MNEFIRRLSPLGILALAATCTAEDANIFTFVQLDRFEYQEYEESWIWDMQGWVGGDRQKFWWKTEGEIDGNDAEIQLLYSRAISPFWDLQMGVRRAIEPQPAENYAVLGLQGLAPQWFEIDLAAFVSDDGDLSARLEIEYDALLTQRLILQPRLEFNSESESTEIDLRLRYEIKREIAPYLGISWNNSSGQKDYVSLVAGARFWF